MEADGFRKLGEFMTSQAFVDAANKAIHKRVTKERELAALNLTGDAYVAEFRRLGLDKYPGNSPEGYPPIEW